MNHDQINYYLQETEADGICLEENLPDAAMKVHGHSWEGEALRTLVAEIKAIINLFPLTVELLSDASSKTPLPPRILLIVKADVNSHHQVSSIDQMQIQKEDGGACSILFLNSGHIGEKRFCKLYKLDKTGIMSRENFKCETQSC